MDWDRKPKHLTQDNSTIPLPTPHSCSIWRPDTGAVWSCMELWTCDPKVSLSLIQLLSFIRIFAIPALEATSSCLHTGVARQQCVHVQKHKHSKPLITLARKPINRVLITCITNAGFADFNSQAVRSSRQLQWPNFLQSWGTADVRKLRKLWNERRKRPKYSEKFRKRKASEIAKRI